MIDRTPVAAGRVRVTLVRSPIGKLKTQKLTLFSMGLRKVNQTVDLPDNASTRGMVTKVHHLVSVAESSAVAE